MTRSPMSVYPFGTTNGPAAGSFTFRDPQQKPHGSLSMTRLKSVPLAIGGLILAAGTVAAFTALPDAAAPGLQKASDASGKTVPVRAVPADVPPAAPILEP